METATLETELRLPKEGESVELITLELVKGKKTNTRVGQVKKGVLSSTGIQKGLPVYVRRENHGCIEITSTIENIYPKNGKIIIESVASIYELRK